MCFSFLVLQCVICRNSCGMQASVVMCCWVTYRVIENYMNDKVNYVLTVSAWDDTFDKVSSVASLTVLY